MGGAGSDGRGALHRLLGLRGPCGWVFALVVVGSGLVRSLVHNQRLAVTMSALPNEVPQAVGIVQRVTAISGLPDELRPTDRILMRWAASVGDGTPDFDEVVLQSKVDPLPDCVAIVVDQLILRSPYRKLTELWYRTPEDTGCIARRLHCSEESVRPLWRSSLRHFRVYFETSPLSDLQKLVGIDVRKRALYVAGALKARPIKNESS